MVGEASEMTTITSHGLPGKIMATLPAETLPVIAEANRRNPTKDVMVLVSEIISMLAGTKQLVPAMQAVGGPTEFVRAVADELRRLRGEPTAAR